MYRILRLTLIEIEYFHLLLLLNCWAKNLKEFKSEDKDSTSGNLSTSSAIAVAKLRGNVPVRREDMDLVSILT